MSTTPGNSTALRTSLQTGAACVPHRFAIDVATRAVAVWLVLLAVAFANGAVRETMLIPSIGPGLAHPVSAIGLATLVALLAWKSVGWIQPRSPSGAWAVGILWVILTVLFEFGAGHYLFHQSWPALIHDYDILAGRLWVLVLTTIVVAPRVSAYRLFRAWPTAPSHSANPDRYTHPTRR